MRTQENLCSLHHDFVYIMVVVAVIVRGILKGIIDDDNGGEVKLVQIGHYVFGFNLTDAVVRNFKYYRGACGWNFEEILEKCGEWKKKFMQTSIEQLVFPMEIDLYTCT